MTRQLQRETIEVMPVRCYVQGKKGEREAEEKRGEEDDGMREKKVEDRLRG